MKFVDMTTLLLTLAATQILFVYIHGQRNRDFIRENGPLKLPLFDFLYVVGFHPVTIIESKPEG